MEATGNILVGELEVRTREHVIAVHGNDVPLSFREFEIIRMLAEHPGWVYSASQLSEDSEQGDYSPESVSVLVSRLRHKLASAGAPDVVETVRGVGYRLHGAGGPHEESAEVVGVSRELRDAVWRLQEAAIEVEHSGSLDQQRAATEAIEGARRAIFASLAE